jgi:spermidine synthase
MAKPPSKTPASSEPPLATPHRLIRGIIGLICFIAGAAIMVIEISANRLLAPNFGNSLYTWTALIGVILISFSVGGFLGGLLADKMKRVDLLGWLLTGAAAFAMAIPALNSMLAPQLATGGLVSGPVLISLLLFALPGILLGAVSPASVRFYSLAGHDEHVGIAAGTISMLGSLGSFVGTFLSGFVLLSSYGVKEVFVGTGIVLLLLAASAFYLARRSLKVQGSAVTVVALGALLNLAGGSETEKGVLYQKSSFYHQIKVTQSSGGGDRYLQLDSTMEGGMTWPAGDLILDYQRYWRLAQLNDDLRIKRALFIGAGAFGMPEHVAQLGKDVSVDVAEIDPAVIETGRRYFKLDEFPGVHAHASDARLFLQQSKDTKYDLVFGDAYNGVRHIPAHLVTREFFKQVQEHLSENGVFLMNVISSVQGERAVLLGHIIATLRAVFPQVEVFAVGGGGVSAQNVILLASMKSWNPWLQERFYAANSWQSGLVHSRVPADFWPTLQPVLTDNWNPVDAVIAEQLAK